MKPRCTRGFLTGMVLAALTSAQTPEPRLRIGPVYTNAYPNLDIVIEAGAGAIAATDLILAEDGTRTGSALSLRKFRETGEGVAILLALDASGSMRGRPLQAVRDGLSQFVSKARANDKIGVLSFADDVRWEVEWSGTREEMRQRLESIQARGRTTVLWDAVDTGLDELAKLDAPARRHLVVISDGHDEGSKKSLEEVISKAAGARIPVDAIGMTRSNPRYLENLRTLSAQSQGSYTRAPDLASLTHIVGNSIDRMLDSPVARFRVERLKADGAQHRVAVYWKSADKQDEMAVTLPSIRTEELHGKSLPIWWYAVLAAAVAALLFLLSILFTRRRTAPMPQPQLGPAIPLPIAMNPPVREAPHPRPPPPPPLAIPAAAEKRRASTQYAPDFGSAAQLIGKAGPLAGRTVRIEPPDFWIGAAENNHLQLDDETVSGNHAVFRFEGHALKIFDNHSTNNTWVNNHAVGETARILFPGDEIQIGRSVFIVKHAEGESAGR